MENSLLLTLELDLEQKNDFAATDIDNVGKQRRTFKRHHLSTKTAHKNSDDEPKALQNEFKRQTELLAETPSELNSCLFSESKKGESSELKSTDVCIYRRGSGFQQEQFDSSA